MYKEREILTSVHSQGEKKKIKTWLIWVLPHKFVKIRNKNSIKFFHRFEVKVKVKNIIKSYDKDRKMEIMRTKVKT